MQDSKPSRSRGIGFVIVCIVVLGTGIYLNAGFNGKIADLQADLHERFKALSEETTGVKPKSRRTGAPWKGLMTVSSPSNPGSKASRHSPRRRTTCCSNNSAYRSAYRRSGRHPQCSG